MTGFIEDAVMRAEGLSDEDIANVNKALPDIQALDEILQKEWPAISRVVTLLLPILNKVVKKQRGLT